MRVPTAAVRALRSGAGPAFRQAARRANGRSGRDRGAAAARLAPGGRFGQDRALTLASMQDADDRRGDNLRRAGQVLSQGGRAGDGAGRHHPVGPEGSITGIIGRSGAGKSTLLRMVNGLERPTTGRVTVSGRDVGTATGSALRAIRRDVGMIFQHFNCWPRARCGATSPCRWRSRARRAARSAPASTSDRAGGPWRAGRPLSCGTVGRAEAARGHRARPGHRPQGPPVGRGDQCAGPRDHADRPGPAGADQPRPGRQRPADHA